MKKIILGKLTAKELVESPTLCNSCSDIKECLAQSTSHCLKHSNQKRDKATCLHCGFTGIEGEDVLTTAHYIGGQGYQNRTYCTDRYACWLRWNQKNGFIVRRKEK